MKSINLIMNNGTSIVLLVSFTFAVIFISYLQIGMFFGYGKLPIVYAVENDIDLKKTDSVNASRVINAPIDKMWNVISNLNKSAQYWPIKVVNINKQTSNTLERDVTIPAPPFMDNKAHQILSLNPNEFKLIELQTQGVVTGVKTMSLLPVSSDSHKTQISIVWDLDLSKIPSLGKGFAKAGIGNSVNAAMEKISQAAVS